MSPTLQYDLLIALGETIYMVFASTFFAILLGLPLGTWLYSSAHIKPRPAVHRTLSTVINITRSIPFIIILVAIIPITRFILGTSIGTNAAMLPLTLGATPLFARLVENTYQSLPLGLLEAGRAMGASSWQMVGHILLPEAMPGLINATTVTAITLVNYSAMAGMVGGGGLGDLAIRYGYQRFDTVVMLLTMAILVIIVQLIQLAGDHLARQFTH